jgi:putative aminopeptidase FrvX
MDGVTGNTTGVWNKNNTANYEKDYVTVKYNDNRKGCTAVAVVM